MSDGAPELDGIQAARLLDVSADLVKDSQRRARALFSGLPLLCWGLAWLIGYTCLELLPTPWRFVVPGICVAAASIASWQPRRTGVRSGAEPVVRRGWLLVAAASPFVIASAGAVNGVDVALLLGALWGLAMALTGVAQRDRWLSHVCFGTLAMVLVARLAPWGHPLTTYGVGSGLLLAVFGAHRLREGQR